MKLNILKYAAFIPAAMMLTSCNDWLGEDSPGSTKLDDYFVSKEACLQTVNGCYSPLQYDFNATYFPEFYFDMCSDDAVKGGQNLADGQPYYDMSNFKTNADNEYLLDYWRAKYMGIARCNLALRQLENYKFDDVTEEEMNAMLGQAYFLRGLYYFQLVRVFGGVPLVDFVVDSSEQWKQPRATAEEVYSHIVSDLEEAEKLLPNKNGGLYTADDLGRATKGAAQAYLLKAYLYMKDYDNAYFWGKKFVDSQYNGGQYSLVPHYYDNFTLAGENGPESVFEVQYVEDPSSDYGGFGFTRGTFGQILTRPRLSSMGNNAGWGFDHPTQNLYDEFEPGDIRRTAAIGVPDAEGQQEVEVNYLGCNYYYNRKVAMQDEIIPKDKEGKDDIAASFPALAHASRGPLNLRMMRASDALLLYAEACVEKGDLGQAKWALEEVRKRARLDAGGNVLPQFPNYNGYRDNKESLVEAIRHERRVELAMEGHRWFDLVRWGIVYNVVDKTVGTYGSTEAEPIRAEMANFVQGKHELFPIPAEEIRMNPMTQNPGY